MPVESELSHQNIKDRYHGSNDPVANKILKQTNNVRKNVMDKGSSGSKESKEPWGKSSYSTSAPYPKTDSTTFNPMLLPPPPPPPTNFPSTGIFYPSMDPRQKGASLQQKEK